MKIEEVIIQSRSAIKQRNIALIVSGILLMSNLFLSVFVIAADKEIVLVPNSIDQEVSVKNGKMSNSYLEALSRDVVHLMLDVTPSNIEYVAKSILKMTHPEFYGPLKIALNERAKDIINRKISTFFSGQSIIVGDDKTSVVVIGKLSTFLGKEEVSVEEKSYAISYSYEGFRPLIINFEEVDAKGNPVKSGEATNAKNHN